MAHYNLYTSLGLDRAWDSNALAGELNQWMESGAATNPGGIEELRIAQRILGDPTRRFLYDEKLNDDSAPDITIDSLRELAETDLGNTAPQPEPNPSFAPGGTPQPNGVNHLGDGRFSSASHFDGQPQPANNPTGKSWIDQVKGSPKMLIIGAVAVIVVLALLLFLLIRPGSGGFASGGDEAKVERAAKEFLSLSNDKELDKWVSDHVSPREQQSIIDGLSSNYGRDFQGIERAFGVKDPSVAEVIDAMPMLRATYPYDKREWKTMMSDRDYDGFYVVRVEDGKGEDTGNRLNFVIVDGKAMLSDHDSVSHRSFDPQAF